MAKREDRDVEQQRAQIRARLENQPSAPVAAPPGTGRRRSLRWPLLIGGGVALVAALGVGAWLLLPDGAPAESPTAFVNARLNRSACSWLQIANVTPAQGGGERVALAGIAASPTAVQASLMRRAMDQEVALAEIDVSDVATGPNEEVRLPRDVVEEVQPNTISVMPAGLDKQLTVQELADLVAFLKNAK